MTDLNLAGESHAHSLIAAGKVDRSSSWSFSAEDGNALLGKDGNDWETYGKFHLGVDRSAGEKTKARYKYPFGKDGKVFRSGVIAAKSRAGQQSDGAVEKVAGDLLEKIDKDKKSAGRFEHKIARFEYKFVEGDGAKPGSFEGYGSVFNIEDDNGDLVAPGAFTKTLAEHKANSTMPKMLLNHGGLASFFANPSPEDMLPIGVWDDMDEDDHGLACKGRLINLDTESGKRIHGAMKEKALDGLSIGFQAKESTRGIKENEPRRTLKRVHLHEVSPVTFPANTQALVTDVKNLRIGTIREFEDFLRDAGGFSAATAKAIAAGGFKAAAQPRDEGGTGDIADLLTQAAGLFRSS